MLRELEIEGVTVFPNKELFSFVPGMNIIVGGNGSGKSHLMKLCYAITRWMSEGGERELPELRGEEQRLLQQLQRVFGIHDIEELISQNSSNSSAHIRASMMGEGVPEGCAKLNFSFRAGESASQLGIQQMPQRFVRENSIFIVPREQLSIYPYYVQAGKNYPALLDGASWGLCRALAQPSLDPHELSPELGCTLSLIEELLGGRIYRQQGKFYLQSKGQSPIQFNLIAEGFKRLGTLGLLLANGSVRRGTVLFWDEPEMNINAAHLPDLVSIMLSLCRADVQVVLSTHSLFLLRELVIQLNEPQNAKLSRYYLGLEPTQGDGVRVSCGQELVELEQLDSLQAEIEQADRYMMMNHQPMD